MCVRVCVHTRVHVHICVCMCDFVPYKSRNTVLIITSPVEGRHEKAMKEHGTLASICSKRGCGFRVKIQVLTHCYSKYLIEIVFLFLENKNPQVILGENLTSNCPEVIYEIKEETPVFYKLVPHPEKNIYIYLTAGKEVGKNTSYCF